jgi:TolA-binding protein
LLSFYERYLFTGSVHRKGTGSEFNRAMELFSKEKYPAAIRLFDSYVRQEYDKDHLKVSDAHYYRSNAALNLFNLMQNTV